MKDLIDIFLDPGAVLTRQRDASGWWPPLVILVISTALVTYLFFGKVDSAWFIEQQILNSGQDVSEQQLAAIREASPGGSFMIWSSTIGSAIMVAAVISLFGVFFMIAGKFSKADLSFKQGLTLASWSQMPTLINTLLMLIGVMSMSPQTSLESLSLTSLNALFLDLPADDPWYRFATTFSVLVPWTIFVAALGWKLWSGATRWTAPIVIATFPHFIIYGAMAIGAMTR
jgi:hypothetical protein